MNEFLTKSKIVMIHESSIGNMRHMMDIEKKISLT